MELDWWTKLLAVLMCLFCILSVSGELMIMWAIKHIFINLKNINYQSHKFQLYVISKALSLLTRSRPSIFSY